MLNPTSRRDMAVALLATAGIHVVFFFGAAVAVANDLIKGKIEPKEKKEKKKTPAPMTMVFEEEFFALPEVETEPEGGPDPLVEVTSPADTKEAVEEEPEMEEPEPENEEPSFVQTREDQEVEDAPEDTRFISERNTEASSDEEAKEGDEDIPSLAGEEERKADPKTFDSQFSNGEETGASDGDQASVDQGKGRDQENQKMVDGAISESVEAAEPSPVVEEVKPTPKTEQLPTIENALAALEEEIAKDQENKETVIPVVPRVEQPKPQPKASERREASNQNGGFAPLTRKTRVAGVLSAKGGGSLNVSRTAVGRYEALILKKLEAPWRMRTFRRKSTLFPGSITLYFVVDQNGSVSGRRQIAKVGASGGQWGTILNALDDVNMPKMPKEVIKELDGKPLEIIVTFHY
ncbi:MAG: hypothetical protein ACON4R_08235 [Akkermansiaceae bacterium]